MLIFALNMPTLWFCHRISLIFTNLELFNLAHRLKHEQSLPDNTLTPGYGFGSIIFKSETNMSLVESLGPHIPYLRRFARALTGNQTSGDTYVRTTLEALASGEINIDENIAPKTSLYKVFLSIWSSSGALLDKTSQPEGLADERVARLTPRSKQAFLLKALEGIPFSEIAIIMQTSEAGVSELMESANAEIEQELKTNVLIIEDEPIIATDIEGLVEELGHDVDGIAATKDNAVTQARAKTPGLILADVQLADGSSGIDAVEEILKTIDVPVIFITAFPERLLTGDKPEPAYLISKPFEPDNVKAAISQALFFHSSR